MVQAFRFWGFRRQSSADTQRRSVALALLLALFGTPACSTDHSTRINIAPSAAQHAEAIAEAVDWLNAQVGYERFTVAVVDSSERIDGEVIVRGVPAGGIAGSRGSRAYGETQNTKRGVIVRLTADADAQTAAHELVHAAGLGHVSDPTNLMGPRNPEREWKLEQWQLDEIR